MKTSSNALSRILVVGITAIFLSLIGAIFLLAEPVTFYNIISILIKLLGGILLFIGASAFRGLFTSKTLKEYFN